MADKTQIFNMALQNLGEGYIMSPSQAIAEAEELNLRYDSARRFVLSMHHWNFATKRIMLNKDAETPAFNWAYQYQLPVDFIKIISTKNDEISKYTGIKTFETFDLVDGIRDNSTDDYIIEGNKLLTNLSDFGMIYIYDAKDESIFSEGFSESLAWYLAFLISKKLTGTADEGLLAKFRETLPMARTTDSQQGKIIIRQQTNYQRDYY